MNSFHLLSLLSKLSLKLLLVGGILLIAMPPSSADACSRCRNYSYCRYKTYSYPVQQVVKRYYTPANTYVVQNNYPAPLVGQGTTSAVSVSANSYQSAALPFLDPNPYFAQEMQLLKAANDTNAMRAERVSAAFTRALEIQAPTTERLAAGQAASQVLEAAGLAPYAHRQSSSQAVVISHNSYGQPTVMALTPEQIEQLQLSQQGGQQGGQHGGGHYPQPMPPAPDVTPPARDSDLDRPPADVPPLPDGGGQYPMLNKYCGKCHGSGIAEPKGGLFLYDDPGVAKTMQDEFFLIVEVIEEGSMPPTKAPQPTDEERVAIIDEIRSIIRNQ